MPRHLLHILVTSSCFILSLLCFFVLYFRQYILVVACAMYFWENNYLWHNKIYLGADHLSIASCNSVISPRCSSILVPSSSVIKQRTQACSYPWAMNFCSVPSPSSYWAQNLVMVMLGPGQWLAWRMFKYCTSYWGLATGALGGMGMAGGIGMATGGTCLSGRAGAPSCLPQRMSITSLLLQFFYLLFPTHFLCILFAYSCLMLTISCLHSYFLLQTFFPFMRCLTVST